ncbi:MAG TPA: M24 family metallopeptidase [Candidatus Dormibacteraeota bacterium]
MAEWARRRRFVDQFCAEQQVDVLVVFGTSANARQGQAQVHFLTGFLGYQDTYVVWVPGRDPVLFVQYFNHVQHARRVARADVRWGGARSIDAVADELAGTSGALRVGLVGPVPYVEQQRLSGRLVERTFVDATADFLRLRLVKSDEELEWMTRAAAITDQALAALLRAAVPGTTELELQAEAAAAAIRAGGQPHFLYLSSTPMANPDRIVPQQELTDRPLQPEDAIILELSAAYTAYSGQVLRTVTVEAELTESYRRLHDVAWQAFHVVARTIAPGVSAAAVVEAASLIETQGFTICDDLVHGYGGGYLPPILRTPGSSHGPVPDFVFERNMTLVIQPNVITTDQRVGVQVGELVRVTDDGVVSLHRIPQRVLYGGEQAPT